MQISTSYNNLSLERTPFVSARPASENRKFSSSAVESALHAFSKSVPSAALVTLFENCLANTLDTTVHFSRNSGKTDTFVVTGDIDAMWLRDSTAQVWPYLQLVKDDSGLQDVLQGVINRQAQCILIDPYANAFNREPSGGPWQSDQTEMHSLVYERKWEIDSLCHAIRLSYGYWKATGDLSAFDSDWLQAMGMVVATFRQQQRKSGPGPYRFQRAALAATDSLAINGLGYPTAPVGLICSAFRPSDDATLLPFLIPANLMAVVSLRQLAEILSANKGEISLRDECWNLADEVEKAVQVHGIHEHPDFGRIYAYEVDGYGGRVFMDDANVPSLLALPYLGYCDSQDPIYKATRAFALSKSNPWMFQGKAASGIGSPHTGLDRIWPLSLIMQGLTSTNDREMKDCLHMLVTTTAGTGLMHEAFDMNDPADFSRGWFAWANSLMGEWLLQLQVERPELLHELLL